MIAANEARDTLPRLPGKLESARMSIAKNLLVIQVGEPLVNFPNLKSGSSERFKHYERILRRILRFPQREKIIQAWRDNPIT